MKKNKNDKKIGLALSGGSALGIAHIGAIKSLTENGISIDCIAGTSAGSLVAALFAFGVPLEKMTKISKTLDWSKISTFKYSKMGLNSNKAVGEVIKSTLGDVDIEDSIIPLSIVVADINSGEKIILKKGNLARAVMASCCIPALFVPVKIGKRNLVDGGLVENLPLSPLVEMGAQLQIGIDLGCCRTYKKTKNILDVISNSYSIMIKHQGNQTYSDKVIIIQPHLEKFTTSDFKKGAQLMKEGHLAMSLKISQIKREMKKQDTTAINFWQRFWNMFSLKVTG